MRGLTPLKFKLVSVRGGAMNCSVASGEAVPGRLSGVPVIRGTRVTPETVVLNRELGVDEIAAQFRLPASAVKGVLSFWEEHRAVLHWLREGSCWITTFRLDLPNTLIDVPSKRLTVWAGRLSQTANC